MKSRLLDYIPEFLPATMSGSKPGSGAAQEVGSEMEYGATLLEAHVARELPRFLVKLVMDSGPAGRAALRGPTGRALLPALNWVARQAMPRDSADLKRKSAGIFGLELEGLSPEDKEFELARHLVRLLRAVIDAVLAPGPGEPALRVRAALALAARRHAPGLLKRAARVQPR
jgi:hypothetical protein